jgi:hypothetical protein
MTMQSSQTSQKVPAHLVFDQRRALAHQLGGHAGVRGLDTP